MFINIVINKLNSIKKSKNVKNEKPKKCAFWWLYVSFCLLLNTVEATLSKEARLGENMQPKTYKAVEVEYQFVDVLREYCTVTRYPLADVESGLDELERQGAIDLFFQGHSREEAALSGIVTQLDDKLIIAFPGTRTDQMLGTVIIDVAEDASMFGSDDGGFSNSIGMENVLVHNGFAKEIMEFWKNMMVYVGKHTNYNEVYFIGHSKGGGMALLTALKYVCENSIPKGSNFVKIFTFAAPAVFRGKEGYDFFHQHIDGRNTICIYKNLDIVPCLVPGYFVHVGILANISKKLESMGNIKEEVSGLGTSLAACVSSNAKTSALKVVAALTKHIASNAVKSHFLTNFSRAQIREVMERIKKNYFEDPEMDFSEMGREKSPALCVIL